MRHDKHKAKKNARYKKQHGHGNSLSKGSGQDKVGKAKEFRVQEEKPSQTATQHSQQPSSKETNVKGLLIEEHSSQSFSRRNIQSNWDKYEDIYVEAEEDKGHSVARGGDFQTLVSQAGGAASQLRMKDEKWWREDEPDETEDEISKLFKVDFKEVADRLLAIPLHQRLGISEKYFEKDVLDRINKDAAYHADRIHKLILEEKTLRQTSRAENEAVAKNGANPDQQDDMREDETLNLDERLHIAEQASCESDVNVTVNFKDERGKNLSTAMDNSNRCSVEESRHLNVHVRDSEDGGTDTGTKVSDMLPAVDKTSPTELPSASGTCTESSPGPETGADGGELEDWLEDYLN